MRPEYFPVPLESMNAICNFIQIKKNKLEINDALIQVIKQNHPGGSFGYKMDDNGKRIVICTDLEHAGETVNDDIVEFCRDADILVHDAQYTTEELKTHKGWGHSSYEQAIEVAEKAGAKQLIMTHHDPDHDDAFLTRMEKLCQERFPNCALAREGMEIVV
jgi:ribonuclease BN (tRNA processing enzyme)